MREVCRNVQIEPTLLQISDHRFEIKVNSVNSEDFGTAVRKHSLI